MERQDHGLPAQLLEELAPALRAAVRSPNAVVAATAMLDVVESVAPFSSQVALRSQWLGHARSRVVQLGEACPDDLEVRLLAAIARTAFAARETTAGLAAADHALFRAIETSDVAAQVVIRAGRLPFLAVPSPVEAAQDARLLDATVAELPPALTPGFCEAEVLLARVAWLGSAGDTQRLRQELATLGRTPLPHNDLLNFVAYASQAALAQLFLRGRQRGLAARALIEAATVADGAGACAELANLQAVIAAIAMQAADFPSAVEHARSAAEAASQSASQHAQPDPWLGLPIDIAPARSTGAAVQLLAEAVLHAQDLGDSLGFLVAASAMGAFYLADDRALEALDALTEAAEVATGLSDPEVAKSLRGQAEALLGHLGILAR